MMAQAFITRRKGGGGVNKDLPAQITGFTAVADSTPSITLNWVNPTEYWAGTLIVKKAGSAPEGVNDGEKIYKGEGTSYTDFDVQFDTEYFYRAFPFNAKKQYQTVENVASAKPVSGIPLSEMAEGTLIAINRDGVATNHYLGAHDYEPELNDAGRQLMIPVECYDERPWGETHEGLRNGYATTEVDAWQNSDYKALFSGTVQEMMGETTFYYTPGNNDYTVSTLTRAVFLLSATELDPLAGGTADGKYNVEGTKLPIANVLRVAYLDGTAVAQLSRTPINNGNNNAYASINAVGTAFGSQTWGDAGSRPCFTLPATALVNPTPNADGSYNLIE